MLNRVALTATFLLKATLMMKGSLYSVDDVALLLSQIISTSLLSKLRVENETQLSAVDYILFKNSACAWRNLSSCLLTFFSSNIFAFILQWLLARKLVHLLPKEETRAVPTANLQPMAITRVKHVLNYHYLNFCDIVKFLNQFATPSSLFGLWCRLSQFFPFCFILVVVKNSSYHFLLQAPRRFL